MGLFDFLTTDIGIDLGTANTLIVYNDEVMVNQPSIVAVDRMSGKVIAIGEEAGSLHEMATKVADFYEREVDDLVDGLTSLMEPIIIVFMGVVVGGLVIAMYMPIFKIASAF